jgi:hypothetical protein
LTEIITQENRYIKTDTYEGVIFAKYYFPTSQLAKHPYFPTDSEIATMEKQISDSISVLLSVYEKKIDFQGTCDIAKDIKKFKRQYYSYWNNGDRIVVIFFYKNGPEDWKKNMFPDIGGRCIQFHLMYSINSCKLYGFYTDLSEM